MNSVSPLTVPPLKGRHSFAFMVSISVFWSLILSFNSLSAADVTSSLSTITSLKETVWLVESGYAIFTSPLNSVLPLTIKSPLIVPPLKGRHSFAFMVSISAFWSLTFALKSFNAADIAISLSTITSLKETVWLVESGYTIFTSPLNSVSPLTVPPLVVERYFVSSNSSDENPTILFAVFFRKIFSPPSAMFTANSPSTRSVANGALSFMVLFLREMCCTVFAIKNEILLCYYLMLEI